MGFTANLYLNNKKVSEILDSADGSYEFEYYIKEKSITKELIKLCKEYYKENPTSYVHYSEKGSEEGLISEIIRELMLFNFIEKNFKKYAKKGLPITIGIDFNTRTAKYYDPGYSFENTIIAGVKQWDDEMKESLKKDYPKAIIFKAYRGLEDFIIK